MSLILNNYSQLLSRVDALSEGIVSALGERITCRVGCSSCCTSISIFPVEAAAMRHALHNLPEEQIREIRRNTSEHAAGERCPLLFNHHCMLYEARPIICRTHGLPILYTADGVRSSDCCPLNLSEESSPISGKLVVDLDKLNTLLAAVNSIYLTSSENSEYPEKLTIAEVILDR